MLSPLDFMRTMILNKRLLYLPADGIEHPGPKRLVLKPVGALDNGGVGGQEEGQPLRHPGGGGGQGVIMVRGEAGPERGQEGKWVEYLTTSENNR